MFIWKGKFVNILKQGKKGRYEAVEVCHFAKTGVLSQASICSSLIVRITFITDPIPQFL